MTLLGRWARDLLEASTAALLLGLFVRTFVAQIYLVPSPSMEPLLSTGDYVLVNKLLVQNRTGNWPNPWLPQRKPAQGDVLVFPHPLETGQLLVKRCVAGSGDHVHIRNKELFVNRELLEEPYAVFRDPRVYPASSFLAAEYRVRDQFGPVVVSGGELFCLGDNRDVSLDSRHWSSIEGRRVVGQAVFAFRPQTSRVVPPEPTTARESGEFGPEIGPESDAARAKPPARDGWRVFRLR